MPHTFAQVCEAVIEICPGTDPGIDVFYRIMMPQVINDCMGIVLCIPEPAEIFTDDLFVQIGVVSGGEKYFRSGYSVLTASSYLRIRESIVSCSAT